MQRHLLLFVFLWSQSLYGQPTEPPAAAKRYHELLKKRPQAGTLFDRFHDAWLESSAPETLLAFLTDHAARPEATAADHRLLALLQSRRGRDVETLTSLEAALKLMPEDADTWLEKARIQGRLLLFEDALESLRRAAECKPGEQQRIEIARQQGKALLRLNRSTDALGTWKELTRTHPDDLELAEDVVELMAEEGLYAEAAAEAQSLAERTRDASTRQTRQLRLGELLLRAEKRDEALAVLENALGQSGQNSWMEGDVLARMEQIFRREDNLDGLKSRLEVVRKSHPQRVQVGTLLAKVLAELGDQNAASQLFRELLAKNPGLRELQEDYISLLERMDNLTDATAQVQTLVTQHPDDRELLIRLAGLQQRQNDVPGAEKTLSLYLQKGGVNGSAPENDSLRVARLLEAWNLPLSARQVYEKLVATYPDSISAQEAFAHYLHRIKDHAAGLKIWQGLVAQGNVEDAVRAGQALAAHGLTKECQALMTTREADFSSHPRFLTLLVQMALANGDVEKAMQAALLRLSQVTDSSGLQDALKLALQAVQEAKAEESVMTRLRTNLEKLAPVDRCLLSSLLEDAGEADDAAKVLDVSNAPPEHHLLLGTQKVRLLELRQQWDEAAEALARLIQLPDGRTSDRIQQLVRLQRRSSKAEEALKTLQEWKTLSPGAVQPWLEEASILTELAQQNAALEVLRTASRKFSENTDVMSTLAAALAQAGKAEEALAAYMALYEQTEDPVARLRHLSPLAQMSQLMGTLPSLLETFQQRQRQNRASPLPWLALASIHTAAGNDEERRRCLYEASRLRPKDLALLTEIARIEEDLGLYDDALRTLTTAAALDKTNATQHKIATLLVETGDEDAGYHLMFQLAGGDTADARVVEKMADTLCESGLWDRALTLLKTTLPRFPKDYRLHYLHAVALEEEGQEKEALAAFVHLLDMHEELPQVLAANPSATSRPHTDPGPQVTLPPGTTEWMQIPQLGQQSYMHRMLQRHSQGRNPWGGMYMRSTSQTTLPQGWVLQPSNVTVLSTMALCHLKEIAKNLPATEQANLARQMQSNGISDASLFLEMPSADSRVYITADLLAKYSDHATLHALWLINNYQNSENPEDLLPGLERCVLLFKDAYPQLALRAGMMALSLKETKADALGLQVLTLFEKTPDTDGLCLFVLVNTLQEYNGGRSAKITLPAAASEKLIKLATRWWTEGQAKNPAKKTASNGFSFLQLLISLERWEEVLAVLNQQNAAMLLEPKTVSHQQQVLNYFSPQPLPAIWNGLDVASTMTAIIPSLLPRTTNDPFAPAPLWVEEDDKFATGFSKIVPKVASAGLKIFLQAHLGHREAAQADLTNYLKQPNLTLDHSLFAASIAQQLQDMPGALAHLQKVIGGNPAPGISAMVDNAVIFAAISIVQEGGQLTADQRTSAADAFARLKKTASAASNKPGLIEVASVLDLKTELEQLQQATVSTKAAATRTLSRPASPYSASHGRRQNAEPTSKLQKLLASNQQEAAFAEIQRATKTLGEDWLGDNWQQSRSLIQNFARVLNDAQAMGRFLEHLKSAPQSGWKQAQSRGALLELLDQKEAAIEAYKAALNLQSRAWGASARLAFLTAPEDAEKALSYLARLPDWELRVTLRRMMEEASAQTYDTQQFEQRLVTIRLLTAFVQTSLNRKRTDALVMAQIAQIPQNIQQGAYGEAAFPGLYEAAPPAQPLTARGIEARKKLRKAHDDFCLALMKIPAFAEIGFSPYAGLALQDGRPLAELESLASEALESQSSSPRPNPTTRFDSGLWQSRQRDQISFPLPQDILLKGILARGDLSQIEATLLPLVKRAAGSQAAEKLRRYAAMHTCVEQDFLENVKAWMENNSSPDAGQEIVNIWVARKLTVPVHEIYLEQLKQPSGALSPDQLTAYITTLAQGRQQEEAIKFLRMVRDIWFGKTAEQRAQAKADHARQTRGQQQIYIGGRHRNSSAGLQAYLSLLSEIIRQGEPPVALRLALEDGLLDDPNLFPQLSSHVFTSSSFRASTDKFIASITELKLLSNAEEFRPWFNQRGQRSTALHDLVSQLREIVSHQELSIDLEEKAAPKNQLLIKLRERQPPTFGRDLLLIFSESAPKTRKSAMTTFLKQRGPELTRLSPLARLELACFFREYVSGYPEILDPEVRPYLQPLEEAELQRSEKMADEILAATSWTAAWTALQGSEDLAPSIIAELAVTDRDKALRLLQHYLALLKSTPRQLQANTQEGGPVFDFLAEMGRCPHLIKEIIALAEKEKLSGQWLNRFSSSITEDPNMRSSAFVKQLFTSSPFVAEAASFSSFPLAGDRNESVLQQVMSRMPGSTYARSREALVHDLTNRAVSTFGTRLTLALLEDNDRNFDRFILESRPDFANLQSSEASPLLYCLSYRHPKYRKPETLPPELLEAVAPLLKALDENDEKLRISIMDAPSLQSLGRSTNDSQDLQQKLRRVIRRDPKAGVQMFEKLTLFFARESGRDSSALDSWLSSCGGIPELLTPVLRRAEGEGLLEKRNWLNSLASSLSQLNQTPNEKDIITLLDGSSFVAPAETFQGYPMPDHPSGSLFQHLALQVSRNPSLRPKVQAYLQAQSATFGSALFLTLIQDSPNPDLLQFVKKHGEELPKLTPPSRRVIESLVKKHVRPLSVYVQTEPALAPFLANQRIQAEDIGKTFLAMTQEQVADMDFGMGSQHSGNLALLAQHDPAGVRRVVDHLLALLTAKDNAREATSEPTFTHVGRFLSGFKVEPALWPRVAEETQKRNFVTSARWLGEAFCGHYFQGRESDDAFVADAFTRSGLFNDVADFNPLPGLGGQNSDSYLTHLLNAGKALKIRPALERHLKAQPRRTFGMDLIAAYVSEDPVAAMDAFVVRRAEDLLKLSPELQSRFFQATEKYWSGLEGSSRMPDEAQSKLLPAFRAWEERSSFGGLLQGGNSVFSDYHLSENEFVIAAKKLVLKLLNEGRQDKADQAFEAAAQVMETQQSKHGWNTHIFYDGWTIRSFLLAEFTRTVSPQTFHFGVRIYSKDRSGNLAHSGHHGDHNWGFFLLSRWQHFGGRADPGHAMGLLLKEILKDGPDTPPALLALAFHNMATQMPETDLRRSIKWADALPTDQASRPLATEFAVAAKLYLEADPRGVGPEGICFKGGPKAQQALWNHYLLALGNEGINPCIRMALGHHLCKTYPWSIPPRVVMPITKLVSVENEALHAMKSTTVEAVIRCFAPLPVDEEWKVHASRLWSGFEKRLANRDLNPNAGKSYPVSVMLGLAMLRLAGHDHNDAWIDRLLKVHAPYLTTYRTTAAVLVYAGYPQKAAALFNEHHDTMTGWQSGIYPWSPDMQTHLPAFLKACKNPGMALLGELTVLQASDPPGPILRTLGDKATLEERIGKLAPRVLSTTFTTEAQRYHAVSMIANYAPMAAFDTLASVAEKAAANIHLADLIVETNGGDRAMNTFLLSLAITHQAAQGNPEPWQKAFHGITKISWNTNSIARSTLNDLSRYSADAVLALWRQGKAKDVKMWLPLFEGIITSSGRVANHDVGIAASFAYVLATQTEGGLEAWKKKLTPSQAKFCREGLRFTQRTLEIAEAFVGPKDKPWRMPDNQRVSLMLDLLKDPDLNQSYRVINDIVETRKLLTFQEVMAHREAVHQAFAQSWVKTYQIIDLAISRNQLSAAAQVFDLLNKSPETSAQLRVQLGLRYAAFLARTGKKKEAVDILAGPSNSAMSEALQDEIEILKNTIRQMP